MKNYFLSNAKVYINPKINKFSYILICVNNRNANISLRKGRRTASNTKDGQLHT